MEAGAAVLAMVVFMIIDGHPVSLPQIVIFGALTLLSSLLLIQFLFALDSDATVSDTSERLGA